LLDDFRQGALLWPESGVLNNALPKQVADIYTEAANVKRLSPNSFAVQIRRALEAICTDRGARASSLHAMLAELVERGELPPVLAEITKVLRLLGNIGAHASDRQVLPSHVDALDEFFRAVVEYVYIARSKLQTFRNKLETFELGNETQET
jgi:hypothetical protein